MIITRTPLRVSFAGGGTDLSVFYSRERGAVLSTAIDKYIYITVNRKFDSKVRASYSITEMVDRASDLKLELIREALKVAGVEGGSRSPRFRTCRHEGQVLAPRAATQWGSSTRYTHLPGSLLTLKSWR